MTHFRVNFQNKNVYFSMSRLIFLTTSPFRRKNDCLERIFFLCTGLATKIICEIALYYKFPFQYLVCTSRVFKSPFVQKHHSSNSDFQVIKLMPPVWTWTTNHKKKIDECKCDQYISKLINSLFSFILQSIQVPF